MQADAYRRARKLLGFRPDRIVASVLGVIQSLLILALLGVVSLFVALLAARGQTRFPRDEIKLLPQWALNHGTEDHHFFRFENTGIFPLIADNLLSKNPIHRTGALLLDKLSGVLVPLRNNQGAIATLLAIGLLVMLVLALWARWRRRLLARIVTDLATILRHQIHRQMYRLGQSSLPTEGVEPVAHLWTHEVNDVRDGLFADLDVTPRAHVLGAGLVLIALLTSPLLTLFLAALGLLVWFTAHLMNRDAQLASDAALRSSSVQLCLLQEDLGLLRTVRIHGIENYDRQRFDEHLDRYRQADAERISTDWKLNPTTGLLYGAALAIALGLLSFNLLIKEEISIATMLVLIAALAGLGHPITEWIKMRKAIIQANRSAAGIHEFLERAPELFQNVGAHFLGAVKELIALENVTLRSRSGRSLLEGVSVEIPAGSRTGIMGLEEDAKQALVCLIPRLIDPQSGRVLIDAHDLRDVTLESVRAQVALVLQADLVFTDSISVNIGMCDPLGDLPRIIEAAKVTHAHQFILDLPHGYDTIIGPLGHYLKPGEQLRIALARAYLHDPSIVIVEEPSLPLDEDTKHLIDDALARLALGRTLILLPHHLSTIRSCDQIILVHNGCVEEVGSPLQLQTESKLFRHLLYMQFNEYATGEIPAGQIYS
jgi:ATP-binding cassette, subfamily B, bacterial